MKKLFALLALTMLLASCGGADDTIDTTVTTTDGTDTTITTDGDITVE